MSKAQFDAFFGKVMEDDALRDRLAAIVMDPDLAKVHLVVAKVAQEEGFDVTSADVAEARVAFRPSGKLSDMDLERVAGGKGDKNCSAVCDTCCGEFLGTWVGRQ